MSEEPAKTTEGFEAKLWDAIAAFEKILEALPNDRVSLETLVDAYEKVGDRSKSTEHGIKLATVLIDAAEEDAARDLLARLAVFAGDDPRIKELFSQLQTIKPNKVAPEILDDEAIPRALNIAAEISFAWHLLQAHILSQDEYARVVHDLSENTARNSLTPVSTLHVLHDMTFVNINSAIAFASTSCKTPLISLATFDIQPAVAALLPLSFCQRRGALVFELMGEDALVAVLNPYDDQLPMDLESITGKTCHLFLAAPEDFDRALNKIREAQQK